MVERLTDSKSHSLPDNHFVDGSVSLCEVFRGCDWPLVVIGEQHLSECSGQSWAAKRFTGELSELANKRVAYLQQWYTDYSFPSDLVCFPFVFLLGKKKGREQKSVQAALHLSKTKQKKTTSMQLSNNKSMCLLSQKLLCSGDAHEMSS